MILVGLTKVARMSRRVEPIPLEGTHEGYVIFCEVLLLNTKAPPPHQGKSQFPPTGAIDT